MHDELTHIGPLPSIFDAPLDDLPPRPAIRATQARHAIGWRKQLLIAAALAAPAAGVAVARATSRWTGIVTGGLAALAIGALRVELARWFTSEPAYQREARLGKLELRRYPMHVEACATLGDTSFAAARAHGYHLLAAYVYGASDSGDRIARTAPVITAIRDGRYTVSFVMPPGRRLSELPAPHHAGIELREVPARRLAALRFRGRFTRDNIATHERQLLDQLLAAGLAARGSVAFAAFDSPATLPLLRRNELWIEIV